MKELNPKYEYRNTKQILISNVQNKNKKDGGIFQININS